MSETPELDGAYVVIDLGDMQITVNDMRLAGMTEEEITREVNFVSKVIVDKNIRR